jgi:hypothetical protein
MPQYGKHSQVVWVIWKREKLPSEVLRGKVGMLETGMCPLS